MRLYHFCNQNAYDALQDQGCLIGDGRRATRWLRDLDARPYHWMAEQMQKRLPPKPACAGAFPVWAWHTHSGKPSTDLRKRGFGLKGKRTVRLTLEIPSELVLLFNEEDWYCVLNGWFVTDTEAKSDLWDTREESWSQERYQEAMRTSWEKIFDLERLQDPNWGRPGPPRYVQACFWLLEANMVVDERWFIPR